jgi:hypothetical protein
MTDNPYNIDPTTLPPELIEDINVITKDVDNVVQYHSSRERLRQFITPPPPECGWYPESVLKALEALRAALEIFEEPYDIEVAIESLVKVRCTLPAGHHEYVEVLNSMYDPCCDVSSNDPIHCGDEHRIDKWVKP